MTGTLIAENMEEMIRLLSDHHKLDFLVARLELAARYHHRIVPTTSADSHGLT